MAKRKLSAFERQFVANRRAGKKEFTFGGKSYTTKQKGEGGGSTKVAAARVKQTLPSKGPIPPSRHPLGTRENPRLVQDQPKGPKRGTPNAPAPTPTKKPEISKITGKPIPIDKPRERKPDAAVTTSTRPNKPSVPTPAGQGTGDIYRIVDRNRTNPPPATADNAAAMAKFNTAAKRGQRVAAGTPFPAAPARKAAGTPLPGVPTPTPKPTHTTSKTNRPVAMPRADFKSKQAPVPMPTMKPTHTTAKTGRPVKMPDASRFGGGTKVAVAETKTTPKTKRVDRLPPHPDRFGDPLLKKKTVAVARN